MIMIAKFFFEKLPNDADLLDSFMLMWYLKKKCLGKIKPNGDSINTKKDFSLFFLSFLCQKFLTIKEILFLLKANV